MSTVNVNTGQALADNRAAIYPPSKNLGKVVILTADKVEDIEFFYPYYRLAEEGYTVDVVTPNGGKLKAYREMELQDTLALADVNPEDYLFLYIPGGLAPTELRTNEKAIEFVRKFAESGKLIGAVCHGPQLLIGAGLVKGLKMTSWREVAPELEAAGATYVNEAAVEDGQFITSRKPGDMPAQFSRIFELLKAGA